jgi:hypothetical protein
MKICQRAMEKCEFSMNQEIFGKWIGTKCIVLTDLAFINTSFYLYFKAALGSLANVDVDIEDKGHLSR